MCVAHAQALTGKKGEQGESEKKRKEGGGMEGTECETN